jgi:selenocysteine lyase/cysteine desulfurase
MVDGLSAERLLYPGRVTPGRQIEMLESWRPYKARPAPMQPVGHRFETGTMQYELLAGLTAALAYTESLGGVAGLAAWERELGERLLAGLPPGARLYGLPTMAGRVPTFLVNFPGVSSAALSASLVAEHAQHPSGR